MTGRYSPRCGLGSIIVGGSPNTLQPNEVTMAALFKSQRYATAITGKWHLGEEEHSWPTNHGFDEYRVGVMETSDSTMYRQQMERAGWPEAEIKKHVPYIWEGDATNGLKKVREYTQEYRAQVEDDIADFSADYIRSHAKAEEPFFLYIGWTQTHYPNVTSPPFSGKSRIGPYGDALLQHDHAVGQVLQAIEEAGIEDRTIVIYLSDNGATPLEGPAQYRGGSNGIYSGELGDAREGSIRVPGMIKWPGKIPVRSSNGMVSIHDFFPTLAKIIGAEVPQDRPIDGIDQSQFFFDTQQDSNREGLLTFIGEEIVGVRWRQYRFYPKSFVSSQGNPSMPGAGGNRLETNGYPEIFNIELDPREERNLVSFSGWTVPGYMKVVTEYLRSLEPYPNPPGFTLTDFHYPHGHKVEKFTGTV
jgi:arylsulfatase